MIGFTNEIVSIATDGYTLTNSAVSTSILPVTVVPSTNLILPARFFNYIGQELIIEVSGRISTLVTTPGTLLFEVKFGSTVVATTQALDLNIVAKTDVTWMLRLAMQLRVVGASAQFLTIGKFESEAVIGSPLPTVGGSGVLLIPASAPAVGNTFNSTTSQTITFNAKWSVADPANSITIHQFRIISPN
jgi:hypothetical protein